MRGARSPAWCPAWCPEVAPAFEVLAADGASALPVVVEPDGTTEHLHLGPELVADVPEIAAGHPAG